MKQEEIKAKLKAGFDRMVPLKDFPYMFPIIVEKDCDYENKLNVVLDEYLTCINGKVDSDIYNNTEKNISLIKEAINCYYNANVSKAKEAINDILKSYISNNFIVSSLDDSPALRGITRILPNSINDKLAKAPLSFFKARTKNRKYTREDFLHIPFNKRGLVATQRFSIAGVPCMYFGASSYVTWIELGKPIDSEFTISSYDIPNDIKILNLAITQGLVHGFLQQDLGSLIEFFPIVIATSFSVSEDERNFKSEYIISQLIMQSLADFGIDGVAYISKRIEHSNPSIQTGNENFPCCVNLAIPMKNDNKEFYSKFANDIPLTNPINLKEFLEKNPNSNGNKISYANLFEYCTVNYNGNEVNYSSLVYSKLDNYLVNQDHKTINSK
jgi:hypothetical protein